MVVMSLNSDVTLLKFGKPWLIRALITPVSVFSEMQRGFGDHNGCND